MSVAPYIAVMAGANVAAQQNPAAYLIGTAIGLVAVITVFLVVNLANLWRRWK